MSGNVRKMSCHMNKLTQLTEVMFCGFSLLHLFSLYIYHFIRHSLLLRKASLSLRDCLVIIFVLCFVFLFLIFVKNKNKNMFGYCFCFCFILLVLEKMGTKTKKWEQKICVPENVQNTKHAGLV